MRSSALVRSVAFLAACASASPCLAASGEFADKAASFLAVFIIIVLPIGGIVLFWLVHVLPEKIAEKRQHPQKDAIHVLCLLSLVFGGMLWPLAWLWAYSKPVLHQLAYGRDKHEDHYAELEEEGAVAESRTLQEELRRLRQDLEALEKRGEVPDATKRIRERLTSLESRAEPTRPGEGVR